MLEFNARFGDPETQAVLPRLRSDLVDLCLGAREPGGLAGATAEFTDDWAVTLVLASAGYPDSSSKGDVIRGLDDAAVLAEVTHAGTAARDGEIVTAGGRVLNVTALGTEPGRCSRSGIRCRQPDFLRWHADADRHRGARGRARCRLTERGRDERDLRGAAASATTMPAVEEAFEEINVEEPQVGIIMGSKNDKSKMQPAGTVLGEAGIRYEVRVMSAHRDPELVREYCMNARMRGLKVIIAGAGMSAALPGVAAAHTDLPVIGVPILGKSLGGLDALLSAAQMPPGVPVACVAIDGAKNAGLLAVRIINA